MAEPCLPQESIFRQALEMPSPEARAALLDRACGANHDLRAEVESLLRANARSGDMLDLPEKPTVTADEPIREGPGTVIGSYKLLEQIGEGGFGVVFMAEQHQPVRRKVALKVLKPGMDTRQVVTRFEAERQALAIMDHPNIAKVLDGGATASGRPFFVMELVKGVPITEYCDQNRLTPRQRLELFAHVCQAVQHAHQKGIIHRDLKPSNVLVTMYDATPVVKVIDFGIAKALGQELTDKTLFTGFTQMLGTPLYMSPEQAGQSALDIDTRSDIYSLGVLLYELLTGTTPFDKGRFRAAAYEEIRRIIREEEPPKPSTRLSDLSRVGSAHHAGWKGRQTPPSSSLASISAQRHMEPAKLTKLVRGELDWLVMKCLEKDRNRRYDTASALAKDIERYLQDEPVQACPPSAWYRFRKFARRNRRVLAAGVLLGVVLLAAVIGLAISNRFIAQERARTDEANARLTANFVVAVHTLGGITTKLAKWLLQDPQRKKEYYQLLEQAVRCHEQLAEQHGDPQVRVGLALCHLHTGNLLLAGGERAKAAEHYRRALRVQTKVIADSADVAAHQAAAYQERLAFVLFHLADLLTQSGEKEEAAEHYQRGLRILEKLVSDWPENAVYYRCLAWNRATCIAAEFRDPAGAVKAGQTTAKLDPGLGNSWTCLGIARYRAGDWQAAVTALEKAASRKGGGDSNDWFFLAMAHWRLGDKQQARRLYDKAVQRMPGPPYCLDPRAVANDRGDWFPLRYDGFRAEAAALLDIDSDQEGDLP